MADDNVKKKIDQKTQSGAIGSGQVAEKKYKKGIWIALVCIVVTLIIFIRWISPFLGFFIFDRGGDSKVPDIPVEDPMEENQNTTPDNSSNKNSTSTKPSAPVSSSTYTQAELTSYFAQAATHNPNGSPWPLQRFTKNIYLSINGAPDQQSIDTINRVIDDFNGLSSSIKIVRDDAGVEIQLFFVPQSELANYGNVSPDQQGFEFDVPNGDCSISYSKLYIVNDPSISNDTRNYLIRHELTHAIGIVGHVSPSTVNSIMANRIVVEHYNELDSKLIQMLYNSGVPLCSDDGTVRSFFGG